MPPITFREVFLGNRVEFILGPLLARPLALLLIPANAVETNRYVMGPLRSAGCYFKARNKASSSK